MILLFRIVLDKELQGIREALDNRGLPEDAVKVSIIVCQKGHHTRLFYEDNSEYLNPCPGLCVDSRGGLNKISDSSIVRQIIQNQFTTTRSLMV